ncbi:MAG TPA: hypothetical protein PK228_03915, partial [Saprospiraceae bacterium]|nr:hypothetical protein [Saprospiraceae bacterium]
MAKKNIPPDEENQSNQPVDPTSERRSLSAAGPDEDLQALMAQVAAIQVKVDKFDFDQFAIDVRVELEAWKDEIRHLLHELEAQMQADRKSFKDLKDLLAKAEALIAKIPVAGDLVKEVLAALSGWQGQINGDLTALRERVQLVENRLTQIGTLLDDHQTRIKRLEDQGLDPEAIRLKVLESLAGWRQEVKDALDALRQQQQNHTGQINQLTAGLEELKKQLATIDFDNLRPEVIRQKVLEALAAWQQQVNATLDEFKAKLTQADTLLANLADKLEKTNKRLDVLENNVRVIESAVNELRKMLEKIISNPQDPELIKRIIKEILEAWQHDVETRLQSHDTDIQFLKNKLNDLLVILEKIIAQPPVDPETIKRQILDALRSWQQQVTNDLTSLGKRTTANEAAITNLQSGLTDLAQKVRELAANGSANVEKVRQELLAALAELEKRLAAEIAKLNARAENGEAGLRSLQAALEALRHQISSDLASLKTRVDNGDTNLTALRAALNELARRLEEIAAKVPNPQDLVKFVFAALAAWQRQMEGKVSGLETKYAGLKTDLEALINRVNDLILNPPTNPEEIQKLIAKTLEDIKAKISGIEGRVDGLEKELHAFILKVEKILNSAGNIEEVRKELLKAVDDLGKRLQTEIDGLKTRIGNGDTLITAIQNNLTSLTVRIEEVAKTVVNPAELKKQILEALAEWQLQIVNDLSGLKTKVQNAETAITALQAALARLAARVEDLIKKGVDEEEVKRIIQQVLTVTLKQIYAEFEIHKDRIENSENEITNLQAALRRLGARIEEIAQSGTDAASVRKDLLAALAALDQQLGGRITVLDGKVADGKSAIEALQTALRDLSLRVDKIVLATTPEEIRNLIIDFISKWEIEIKNAVE